MIDPNISDCLEKIKEWVKADTVNRGCFLFLCEDNMETQGAFCAHVVHGKIVQNLGLLLAENDELFDVVLDACTLAAKLVVFNELSKRRK